METCTAEFARLSSGLGGVQCDGNPFLTLRNPFGLQNWTLPVIELTLVVGAIACLIHALRWRRAHGDASNLVVWISSIFCLMLIEPVAYFPQWFGLEDSLGLTFVHNQFSVQFLYDRMPLYIIAMYPVFGYVSYVLIQRTGIFKRYNVLIGATCMAFTFHVLYEVVDTVGVQFRWWVWNQNLPTSVPALGVVPYLNIQAFSLGLPFGLALLSRLFTSQASPSGWSIARSVVLVCLCIWPIQFLSSLPATLVNLVGVRIGTARLVCTWLLIVAAGAITAAAFVGIHRARRTEPSLAPPGVERDYFALWCVSAYLVVSIAIWGAALPDYLAAKDGITRSGAPTGSLAYAVVTAILSVAVTAAAYRGTARRAPVAAAVNGPVVTSA